MQRVFILAWLSLIFLAFESDCQSHTENVAFYKTSRMSSKFESNNNEKNAVNGNTDGVYSATGNCIQTGSFSHTWWEVDLGRPYPVHKITVWARDQHVDRMSNVAITVDWKPCYTFGSVPYAFSRRIDLNCSNGIVDGAVVRLARNSSSATNNMVTFCEIQIWSCNDQWWGTNCDRQCGQCKDGVPCNKVNGHCLACPPGYQLPLCKDECPFYQFGENCAQYCSQNCINVCDKVTGHCTCKPGWKTPNCTQRCDNGFYGQDCAYKCGRCYASQTCDYVSGTCAACEGNYRPPLCKECRYGTYGPNCTQECSKNCGTLCDSVTGSCTCRQGWMGATCMEPCPSGRFGVDCKEYCGRCNNSAICSNVDGHCSACQGNFKPPLCKECQPGYYDFACNSKCSNSCADGVCGMTSGNCTCKPGWQPPNCLEICTNGRWGVNCNMTCSINCSDVCDKETGRCTCKPGWTLPSCADRCPKGYYGQNCTSKCGNCTGNDTCRYDTGVCERGCAEGFTGNLCQESTAVQAATIGGIIGGILGGVFILIIIVIIVIFAMRKCEKEDSEDSEDPVTSTGAPGAGGSSTSSNTRFQNLGIDSSTDNRDRDDSGLRPRGPLHPSSGSNSGAPGSQSAHTGHVNQAFQDDQKPPIFPQFPTPKPKAKQTVITVTGGRDTPTSSRGTDVSDDGRSAGTDDTNSFDEYARVTSESVTLRLDGIQQSVLNKLRSGTLDTEFEKLPFGLDKPHTAGAKEENYYKNRFTSILPYDATRVILRPDGGPNSSDYINASYIKGYWSLKAYISAQAPLERTLSEWWRMVVQDRVTHIVMLTSVAEGDNRKSVEYWPPLGSKRKYGSVDVTGLEVQERADYITRIFDVKGGEKEGSRQVNQFHYMTWPDHSVPSATGLVDFWRTVRASHRTQKSPPPLLVHCSAGVGRSGTFIGLDMAMDDAENKAEVGIFNIMERMRKDRCNMIQTKSQYRFLHEAFLEAYSSRHSRMSVSTFETTFKTPVDPAEDNTKIDQEFQELQQVKTLLHRSSHTEAQKEENIGKNRSMQTLPDDRHLVYLTTSLPGRNQYINAVYMPTFLNRRGCILTQLPLSQTVVDIWRLIADNDVTTVVSLGSEVNDSEVRCCYWPRQEATPLKAGPFTVTLNSKSRLGENLTTFRLSYTSENVPEAREVYVVQYADWTGDIPGDDADLINLIDMITSRPQEDKDTAPVVIQCLDGAAKSGMFRAICDVISRMTYDQQIDVYMAVRHVHIVRPQCVSLPTQYRYLYHIAQEYKKRNSPYELP